MPVPSLLPVPCNTNPAAIQASEVAIFHLSHRRVWAAASSYTSVRMSSGCFRWLAKITHTHAGEPRQPKTPSRRKTPGDRLADPDVRESLLRGDREGLAVACGADERRKFDL